MTRAGATALALALLAACALGPETETTPAAQTRGEADGATLIVELQEDRLPITEPVRIRVKAIVDESRQVELPDRIGSPEDFAVAASAVSDPLLLDDGRVAYERVYDLEAYLPGEYPLGAVEIEHWPKDDGGPRQTLTVEAPVVTVDSVLLNGDEEQAELKDIRDPVAAPRPWAWLVAAGLAALACGALGYWLWKRRRPSQPRQETAPLPPPHVAALAALDELVAQGLTERGEHKLFYGLVSNIVRRYVEDRFGVQAPERTTEEFLQELRGGWTLGPAHQGLLKMFLVHSDLVKFAEMEPGREDVARSISLCRRFIEETAPRGLEAVESPAAADRASLE